MGTEVTLSRTRHANLVFLHARRQTFPTWQELDEALEIMWPWGEAACVQEVVERRVPHTSHGIHDAEEATRAGAMTLEALERYCDRASVDDYQQSWDGLRRQIRAVLWEEAVRQTGVPPYLGAPDDLKLLLMKG